MPNKMKFREKKNGRLMKCLVNLLVALAQSMNEHTLIILNADVSYYRANDITFQFIK